MRDGMMIYLHRFIYEECFGEIPRGMCVMHTCDEKMCMNPGHLILGTLEQNSHDEVVRILNKKGLTKNEVIEIRGSKDFHKDLAKRYQVSRALISLVQNRKRWASIA